MNCRMLSFPRWLTPMEYKIWLVWNSWIFSITYGNKSSQLTFIFFRGVETTTIHQPYISNQKYTYWSWAKGPCGDCLLQRPPVLQHGTLRCCFQCLLFFGEICCKVFLNDVFYHMFFYVKRAPSELYMAGIQ